MPPVKTSASHPEADNEATAELPVLDVAAYESTLSDTGTVEVTARTDSWVVVGEAAAVEAADATTQMPAVSEAIPTLRPAPAPPAYDLDHSGTHEMPPLLRRHVMIPGGEVKLAPSAAPAVTETRVPVAASIEVPPSPPLIEELRGALAAAERRVTELEERARIADTERQVALGRATAEADQLREQLGTNLEALQAAREKLLAQTADQPRLEDLLLERGTRIAELERQLEVQRGLMAESAKREDSLGVDVMNLHAALARRNAQIGILEADMQARQQRELQLKAHLADALAASDPHVPQLRAELAAREEDANRLAAELTEAKARIAERDGDLEVAEENIRNLEIEVRDKSGKLAEASVAVEEWRAVIAESQRSILQRDSRIQQLETDLEKRAAMADLAAQAGEQEVALEGPARVLIRTDGNTEFVHVLGRRTRIGRGPDNELVLDTKHVSRYHTVLLAGPVNTTIEDLNSTNGVFVNGKRIARQVLKDGDRVTIGRSQFRYTVRG